MWPAMVVRPGPPGCEAWDALKASIVAKSPEPGEVSVKYVHGPGGPSKASRSILVKRPTSMAGGPIRSKLHSLRGDTMTLNVSKHDHVSGSGPLTILVYGHYACPYTPLLG